MKAEQKICALEEQVGRLQKQLVVRFLHVENHYTIGLYKNVFSHNYDVVYRRLTVNIQKPSMYIDFIYSTLYRYTIIITSLLHFN